MIGWLAVEGVCSGTIPAIGGLLVGVVPVIGGLLVGVVPVIGGLLVGVVPVIGWLAVEGCVVVGFALTFVVCLTRTFRVLLSVEPLLSVTVNSKVSVVSADTRGAVKDQTGVSAPLNVIK